MTRSQLVLNQQESTETPREADNDSSRDSLPAPAQGRECVTGAVASSPGGEVNVDKHGSSHRSRRRIVRRAMMIHAHRLMVGWSWEELVGAVLSNAILSLCRDVLYYAIIYVMIISLT